jgi:RsiW-degrading membrane proteinase PrsW (M82 family)
MYRAGQFLIQPSEFLNWLTLPGIMAVGVMLYTLYRLHENLIRRLSPDVTLARFAAGLAVGGAVGIASTLILTVAACASFEATQEWTGAVVNENRIRASGIDQQRYAGRQAPDTVSLVRSGITAWRFAGNNPRASILTFVVGVLLLVVGCGYACTLLQLGFVGSFAAMSAGVGLPEELAKAAAGLLILYHVFDTKVLSEAQFKRAVLAAFATAGLGFGAGEALRYFGAYANEGAGFEWYLVRAVWCVTLHGAWTLIVGAVATSFLPQNPAKLEGKFDELCYQFLILSIPVAIAHGLYNACCGYNVAFPWIAMGVLSFVVASVIVRAFLERAAIFIPAPRNNAEPAVGVVNSPVVRCPDCKRVNAVAPSNIGVTIRCLSCHSDFKAEYS